MFTGIIEEIGVIKKITKGVNSENVPGWSVGRGFITDINNADKNALSESFCKSKYKEDFESA